jgi:hypothetical protein
VLLNGSFSRGCYQQLKQCTGYINIGQHCSLHSYRREHMVVPFEGRLLSLQPPAAGALTIARSAYVILTH